MRDEQKEQEMKARDATDLKEMQAILIERAEGNEGNREKALYYLYLLLSQPPTHLMLYLVNNNCYFLVWADVEIEKIQEKKGKEEGEMELRKPTDLTGIELPNLASEAGEPNAGHPSEF